MTRLLNLQVVEKSDGSGIIDAVTRLSCEAGIPKILMMDQDPAIIKALSEVEYEYHDTKMKLHEELGIEFFTCPVSGHNQHGQVERRIRTIQESLAESGIQNKRLHATGLQTLMKLTENQLNNLPLGYSYGRDQDNTPLLKMLTPNMLRVGRNNVRALDGPMRLPEGGELLDKVQEAYEAWYKIWNTSYVPKLMHQPKWWKQDRDIQEGDIIFFQKRESELDTSWTLATIDQLVKGRDGLSRRAVVKYQNPKENFHRVTDRHIRSLVKVWSVDDQNIDEDLAELQRRLMTTGESCDLLDQLLQAGPGGGHPQPIPGPTVNLATACDKCCCDGHCKSSHPADQQPPSTLMSALLAQRPVDLGHSDEYQLGLALGDLDQAAAHDGEHAEEDSCDCSLTAVMSSLSLNLD